MPTSLRFLSRVLVVGTLIIGLLGGGASALAATGDIGFRDQSYAPAGGSPSGTKPESKLWFNNGWWASMWSPSASANHIFKLDRNTGTWSDTGTAIDARNSTRADALWDAAANKLYMASHIYTTSGGSTTSGNAGRLYRYSYSAATGRYTLDGGFPVTVDAAKTETLVIDKDSTGTIWATWTAGSRVYVNHTVGGNDASWGTPYIVPGAGTTLTSDDISSLIHFGDNKIGVMWSNQADSKVYFAVHSDGASDAAASWSTSVVPTGASSDDHINLKTDAAGRVYAAVKTSESSKTRPLILLLVRSAAGAWSTATFGTVADSHTRPIVLLDAAHNVLHMFATCPQPPSTSGQSGGDICEKTAPMGDSTSFGSGIGTAVIREAGVPDMNDATSTKQNLNSTTGLVVLANNATSDRYWHMQESLGGSSTGPTASFNASPTSGPAPLSVAFTDTSTGSPTSWSWNFGDGQASTDQSPTHVYSAAGTYTVSLTASNAGGSDSASAQIVVDAPGGGGTPQVFMPAADAQVKSTSASTNYGTLASIRIREGTSPTDVTYHSYLRFVVSGLAGPVTSAKLRLYVTDASRDSGTVLPSPDTWSESTLTWNNAPALGTTPIATLGPTPPVDAWDEIDLGSAVTGDGTYSLGLASSGTDSAIWSSREGAHPPELVITTG
jgi:PKD repeat protein